MLTEDIARGYHAADQEFKESAYETVCAIAGTRAEFTAADVWAALSRRFDTHDRRAMGGVLTRAKANRIIAPSGRTASVACPRNEGTNPSPRAVWRSLIVKAA